MENNNNYQDPREIDLDGSPVIEEEQVEDNIELNLINGDTFLIDPKEIDWNHLHERIGDMYSNLVMIRKMIFDITVTKDPHVCEKVIHDIDEFTKGFDIALDYSKIRDDITDAEKGVLMCIDALEILKTIIHQTEIHYMVNNVMNFSFDETHAMEFLSMLNELHHDDSCDCGDCHDSENDNGSNICYNENDVSVCKEYHEHDIVSSCDNNEDINENETMEEE